MATGNCSELASLLTEIARQHVRGGLETIDDVVVKMQTTLPTIDRNRLVDSIIEVSDANKTTISDLEKRLAKFAKEARTDKTLRDRIDEAVTALQEGTLPVTKERPKVNRTQAIQNLYDTKNALMKQLAKSEPALKAKYQKQLDRAYKGLADTNFRMPQVREQEIEGSEELQALRFELAQTRNRAQVQQEKLRPKTIWEKGVRGANAIKSLMTTGEFSGVLRQGKFAAFVTPEVVPKSMVNMFRAFASEKGAFEAQRTIDTHFMRPALDRAGLDITDINGPLTQMEESIMSPYAGQIPFFKRFDRAYNTYLNSLRFYGAVSIAENTFNGQATAQELEAISHTVNVFTGRGSMGKYEQAVPFLNATLFSPRYQMSRLQMLTGEPIWNNATSIEAKRKLLARFYGRSLVGQSALYALYGLLFGRDNKQVLNPLSSDFGKIITGNTRLDPMAGLTQPIVFLARAVSGSTTITKGKTKDIRGEEKEYGQSDIVSTFLRSKLAPIPGVAWDVITGEDVTGHPVTVQGELARSLLPMTYGDIHDVMTTELDVPQKAALSVLSFFGESVQVYDKRSRKRKK